MVKHCKYHFRSHWIDCFDHENTAWYFEYNAGKQEIVNAVYDWTCENLVYVHSAQLHMLRNWYFSRSLVTTKVFVTITCLVIDLSMQCKTLVMQLLTY